MMLPCIFGLRLPPEQKLVAIALADNVVDEGGTFHAPLRSVERLSCLDRNSICVELDELARCGVISKWRIEDERHGDRVYPDIVKGVFLMGAQ